jgi:hypothetical protein
MIAGTVTGMIRHARTLATCHGRLSPMTALKTNPLRRSISKWLPGSNTSTSTMSDRGRIESSSHFSTYTEPGALRVFPCCPNTPALRGKVLKTLPKLAHNLRQPINNLLRPINNLQQPIDDLRKPENGLREPINNLPKPENDLRKRINDLRKVVGRIRKPVGRLPKVVGDLRKVVRNLNWPESTTYGPGGGVAGVWRGRAK